MSNVIRLQTERDISVNTCITLTCELCEQDIDCRIGYSNRAVQPLRFACPHCETSLNITLDIAEAPKSKFSYTGCRPSDHQPGGPFVGSNPFVDLHLDFPVRFGKYVLGDTPWFASMRQVEEAIGGDRTKAFEMSQWHGQRLDLLNSLCEKSGHLRKVVNLYLGNNKQLFQQRACEFLEEEQNPSLLPQDINATLYRVIAKSFFPFVVFEHGKEISEEFPRLLYSLDSQQLDRFIGELILSKFLQQLQRDCLKIYPRILDAEIPLRPALFLDLIKSNESERTSGRVSSQDFLAIKDLYKDIVEILARQLVIVAGINNLLHRNDAHAFPMISGGVLGGLEKFSGKPLADRFKYLDDCWYVISIEVFNLELRNSIAHNNLEYQEISQTVRYFPEGGRLTAVSGKEMSFLDFMRQVLLVFREMHNMHHLIKSLFYYEYLIRQRRRA